MIESTGSESKALGDIDSGLPLALPAGLEAPGEAAPPFLAAATSFPLAAMNWLQVLFCPSQLLADHVENYIMHQSYDHNGKNECSTIVFTGKESI